MIVLIGAKRLVKNFCGYKLPADGKAPNNRKEIVKSWIDFFQTEAVNGKYNKKHPDQIHHIFGFHFVRRKQISENYKIGTNCQGNPVAGRDLL